MNDQTMTTDTSRPLDKRLRLGARMKDLVTGLEGMAYVHIFKMCGSMQFGVVPQITDKEPTKLPDMQAFDEHMLEVIGDGVTERVQPYSKPVAELGDEVKHVVTGVTGIVTSMSFFMNGCCYMEVMPKAKRGDNTQPASFYGPFSEYMVTKKQQVKVAPAIRSRVKAAIQPPAPQPVAEPAPAVRRPPGGPMTKMRRLA